MRPASRPSSGARRRATRATRAAAACSWKRCGASARLGAAGRGPMLSGWSGGRGRAARSRTKRVGATSPRARASAPPPARAASGGGNASQFDLGGAGMLRVGVMIEGQEGLTWERWRRIAETAEALGFESLWRSDHLFSLYDVPTRPGLDTWASLAHLAAITRRLRFGPLVCPITFPHPPVLARQG